MTHDRIAAALALLIASTLPAAAQDLGGAIDLGQLSRTQTQSAMMRGHAERDGARMVRAPNGVAISVKARNYCENYPVLRRRHGADDARVVRLAAACRRAGYRY